MSATKSGTSVNPPSQDAASLNTHCPWSGKPVSPDSLTTYRGKPVGFCNPGCRDKFETALAVFDPLIERADPEMP